MTGGKIDVDKLPTIDFSLETDPASPEDGRIWWNETEKLLKIADPSGVYTFNGTLAAWDTTPAAFSFTDVTNATTNSTYTSAAITVSGINHPAAISVSGDASAKYSVNNATATATNGTVESGDEVRAVVTSSASDATAVNATVTIGGVSDVFSVTTAAGEAVSGVCSDDAYISCATDTTSTSIGLTVASQKIENSSEKTICKIAVRFNTYNSAGNDSVVHASIRSDINGGGTQYGDTVDGFVIGGGGYQWVFFEWDSNKPVVSGDYYLNIVQASNNGARIVSSTNTCDGVAATYYYVGASAQTTADVAYRVYIEE